MFSDVLLMVLLVVAGRESALFISDYFFFSFTIDSSKGLPVRGGGTGHENRVNHPPDFLPFRVFIFTNN